MKIKKKLGVAMVLGVIALSATACSDAEDWSLSVKSQLGQLPLVISTYDNNGQKVDQVKAKSVHIHTDTAMHGSGSDGNCSPSAADPDSSHNTELLPPAPRLPRRTG